MLVGHTYPYPAPTCQASCWSEDNLKRNLMYRHWPQWPPARLRKATARSSPHYLLKYMQDFFARHGYNLYGSWQRIQNPRNHVLGNARQLEMHVSTITRGGRRKDRQRTSKNALQIRETHANNYAKNRSVLRLAQSASPRRNAPCRCENSIRFRPAPPISSPCKTGSCVSRKGHCQ